MRSDLRWAAALALAALVGCESTAPESTIPSCEPVAAIAESAAPVYIHMSPLGSDENDGSDAAPVATLSRVQDILRGLRPADDVIVRIRSDEGVYYDQSVMWDYVDAEHNITFESYPESLYASFSEGRADTTFFILRAAAGRRTNLHFKRLSIEGYAAGAVWFAGDPEKKNGWNGANTITNCVMRNVGNEARLERSLCWAVIDLVNSRHNVIEKCTFVDCANANTGRFPQDTVAMNLASGPNLPIIGIYLAHGSSCNYIAECTFRRIKGDVVRIRDGSNENEICRNYFEQTGWTAVCTMWYRYRRLFSSAAEECPSWNNTFHHNRAEGNWLCGPPLVFHDMAPELSLGCPTPADGPGYRIRLWDNETDACKP